MPGTYIRKIWRHDPALSAPARYRRACGYDAFVPGRLAELAVDLSGDVAGVLSDAENAIADLNGRAGPELAPLARLLLRTESIASSKVEGMQSDARTLARAEANRDTGRNIGRQAAEIIANIDAMEWAVEEAAGAEWVTPRGLRDIHRILLANDEWQKPGELRNEQNWIGGNDYTPCGADFVPPPPEEVPSLIDDLCAFCNDDELPPLLQAAIAHAQFETIHPFGDGKGRAGGGGGGCGCAHPARDIEAQPGVGGRRPARPDCGPRGRRTVRIELRTQLGATHRWRRALCLSVEAA